jgi:muconate cycloisomerase
VALFEQPTPDGDYAGMARVRREIAPTQVMADDGCFNLAHARELVRNGCCDVISVYPGKNGGIRKTAEIVQFAAEHAIACSIGSNLEWDVATAAMGHVVVALENMQVEKYPGDALGPVYHEFSIVREPLEISGPLVTVPDRPGLGVEVNWDLVRRNVPS